MELKYFSQHYKIALAGNEDWFDPRMSLDTKLYIDPFMVFKSKHPLFINSKKKFFDFFKAAFELAHEAISDEFAKDKLELMLKFPEVKEVCLGLSEDGTDGSGSGGGGSKSFAEAFVKLAKNGYLDIDHFEKIEIFTGGIGADKISDATANILKLELIEYTRSICQSLNVPTSRCAIDYASCDLEDKSWDGCISSLPNNPFFEKGRRGLILVPKEFLRAFHTISSEGFSEYIRGKKNQELRTLLNYDLNKELKKDDFSKTLIANLAQSNPNWVSEYVKEMEDNEAEIKPYNLEEDKRHLYRNEKKASEFILANPLTLSASNEPEFVDFLERIVGQCKLLIEEKEGYKLLWDAYQLPDAPVQYKSRTESETQNLLTKIIVGYCQASNIKISKESDICKRAINFKFPSKYQGKAVIKLQLTYNIPVKDGLNNLLKSISLSGTGYNYHLLISYTEPELERVENMLQKIAAIDLEDTKFKLLNVNAILDKSTGERPIISSSTSVSQSDPTSIESISSHMNLSGQQSKKLQEAIIDAFPNMASLEQMLQHGQDKNLRAIAGEGSLQEVAFRLIREAKAQGWIEDLIRTAREDNPGNQQLRDIAQEILPNPDLKATPTPLAENPQKEINQLRKILILAAIPHGLRLDKEIREIEEAIRRAINRDLFEIRIRTAVRPQDIRRVIAEEQPQIVHFCGHGLEDGTLLLEDDGGNDKPVAPEGLASLFELHADYVECVVLNACYSEKSAIAISKYINYAIGMNQPIKNKAAIAFAQGFYDGLSYKQSTNKDVFQRAFDEAVVAIKLENYDQGSIPVLKKNFN
jgi:Effector-associated domain 1/CHAT domain